MREERKKWAALGVLCLSLLIVSIDNSILNVVLPTLVRQLGATPSQLQWIVDAYTLVFTGVLLTGGSLGDRYGRRGVMTVGLVIFGGASLGATLATRPSELIAWRGVMGIGAALIMPSTLSILVALFTEPRQRRRAIAYWTLMNATGTLIGPITGGLLLRHFWWGSCFLVNVPVVVVALVAGRPLVPTSKNPGAAHFDLTGAVLSTLSLGSLLWAIIEGPGRGWTDPAVVSAFVASAGLGAAFVLWERRTAEPMLDLTVLERPQVRAAAAAITICFVAMGGTMFLILQTLQLAKGYSPLVAALAAAGPITLINFTVIPAVPRLTERFGLRTMIVSGLGLIACASLIIASTTTVHSGYAGLLAGFSVMSVAFSVLVPATTEAIITAVPAESSGGASAINQMTRQLGQSLGVAMAGSIAALGYRAGFDRSSGHLARSVTGRAGSSITTALVLARHLTGAARRALLEVSRAAFVHGVRLAIVSCAVLAFGGAILAAVEVPARRAAVAQRTPVAQRTLVEEPMEVAPEVVLD